jgi:hypothetical protein
LVKLTLSEIQSLAASPDYGGRGFLQPSSAVLGLSWALYLSNLSNWQGAGYKLTDSEIDDIQAMVAQLEEDLMLTGDMYPMDRVQVYNNANQSIAPNLDVALHWNAEIYDPENMHSLVLNDNRIYAVRDGLHIINVNVLWAANQVGTRKLWLSHVEAATGIPTIVNSDYLSIVSSLGFATQLIATQAYMLADDYLQCVVKQTSPAALSLIASTHAPLFSVVRL